ncbi:MAG TPA: LysM peptidoglycan-binding domain-containing protein [Ktedonobacteraceae bacterium]|nr:LysM peptidoglycan-binding domain-containing protein [Ktedonobacteraceae bacterium]
MQTHQTIWQYFRQHHQARITLEYGCVLLAVGTVLFSGWSMYTPPVFAQPSCSGSDQTYVVVNGDTLSEIAARNNINTQDLAAHNQIAETDPIYPDQTICIPGSEQQGSTTTERQSSTANAGQYNPYPPGQCTWWADERYHQLHGVYVPWLSQSDAWQWTQRAQEFNWHLSTTPSVGAIVDLQPWVQGAYGMGHVAVVESILPDGHVIASNLNWAGNTSQPTNVEFAPGPGVTFISAA